MPNILFASNNIGHFPNALAGSVVGTFDSTRVPYSIAVGFKETLGSPIFTPSTTDNTWFHFRIFASSASLYENDPLFLAYDENNKLLFKLNKRDDQDKAICDVALYDGTSTVTAITTIGLTLGKLGFMDFHYKTNVLGIDLKIFCNGFQVASLALASNPNNYLAPVRFIMGQAFGVPQHMSEIIVADGDTRNSRLNLLRPTAAGAYNDWIGSLAALADDDMTTGMTTIAAAQRQNVLLTPYSGAANISNVVAVSATTRGINSPTGLKHSIRLSGVDYDSALIPLGFPLQYNLTDWLINPATSLPWVASDLSAIETGILSVA